MKTKDDLIAVMDDALMGEALLPSIPKDWRRALTEIATRTHDLFLRHPWALVSMLSAPPGINAMRHMEQCLEALAGTSMTAQQKLALLATVDDFVFGHALREGSANGAIDVEFAKAQMATGAFPRLAEVFGKGRIPAQRDRFKKGLKGASGGGVVVGAAARLFRCRLWGAVAVAVEDAEVGAPWTDGVVILVSHDAGELMEMGEVVGGPCGEELRQRHGAEGWMRAATL